MCLADFDRNDFERRLRQLPLPAAADSTSASPRAVERTVVSATAGNPSIPELLVCSAITSTIVTALVFDGAVIVRSLMP